MGVLALGQLRPHSVIERLLASSVFELRSLPFGPMLMVIAEPEDAPVDFLEVLDRSIQKDAPVSEEPAEGAHTAQFPTMPAPGEESFEPDQVELLAELAERPHAIWPLRYFGATRILSIGRSPASDLVLPDPSVSAQHASLILDAQGVRFRDNASKNGSTLNGRALDPNQVCWLQPMDRVSLGRVKAFFCDPGALRAVLRTGFRPPL